MFDVLSCYRNSNCLFVFVFGLDTVDKESLNLRNHGCTMPLCLVIYLQDGIQLSGACTSVLGDTLLFFMHVTFVIDFWSIIM